MGTLSNNLNDILNSIKDAKNSINNKYDIMGQQKLQQLYAKDLSSSIDKINCINTNSGNAEEKDVLKNKKVYVKNKELIGSMKDNKLKILDGQITEETSRCIMINMYWESDKGYCDISTYFALPKRELANYIGLTPDIIKKGENILDIIGEYDPDELPHGKDVNKILPDGTIINEDTNGDGIPDINIDIDDDDVPDMNIDIDGDKKPDLNIDTDGTHKPDLNIDTDGDKKPDINIDIDGDNKPDINIDLDNDKKPDLNIDTNNDNKPDVNIDTNNDNIPDTNIDTNNDNKPDKNIINKDTNNDGKPDINIDIDDDNIPDINIDIPDVPEGIIGENYATLSAFISFGSSKVNDIPHPVLYLYYNKGRANEELIDSYVLKDLEAAGISSWDNQDICIYLTFEPKQQIYVTCWSNLKNPEGRGTIVSTGKYNFGFKFPPYYKFMGLCHEGNIHCGVCSQDVSNINFKIDASHNTPSGAPEDNISGSEQDKAYYYAELKNGFKMSFDKNSNGFNVNPTDSEPWSVDETNRIVYHNPGSSTFNALVSSYGVNYFKYFNKHQTIGNRFNFGIGGRFTNASGNGALGVIVAVQCKNSDLEEPADGDNKPDLNIDTDGDNIPDTNIDTTGDKKPDTNIDDDGDGKPDRNIDTDRDGKPDFNIDDDGDGKPDRNIVDKDTNGDGIPDINIDTNNDGIPDINIDTNGDNIPDLNIDTNNDGKPDLNIDTNNDGKPDLNIDINGDGIPDINIDTDGDGIPDLNIDTNGDGKPDVNIDTDNDGVPDINIDTNGDGKPDLNIDTNKDGVPDINIDTDNDGIPDLNIDTNNDGKPDLNIDTNNDGKPDLNIDTNGDNIPDINIDTDGDNYPDLNIDTDGDNYPDLNIDDDNDGIPDRNIDTDGDGEPDRDVDIFHKPDDSDYDIDDDPDNINPDKDIIEDDYETCDYSEELPSYNFKYGYYELHHDELSQYVQNNLRTSSTASFASSYTKLERLQECYRRIYNAYAHHGRCKKYKVTDYENPGIVTIISKPISKPDKNHYRCALYLRDLRLTAKEVQNVYMRVHYDCPELIPEFRSLSYSLITYIDSSLPNTVNYAFITSFSYSVHKKMMNKCYDTLKEIHSIIKTTQGINLPLDDDPEGMACRNYYADEANDRYNSPDARYLYYETLKMRVLLVIHDYLVTHNNYQRSIVPNLDQTMYPALSNGADTPVCASYAHALQWVAHRFGICALVTTGYAGEEHMWNTIYMGQGDLNDMAEYLINPDLTPTSGSGTYDICKFKVPTLVTSIDATWDDPLLISIDEDFCKWDYFLIPFSKFGSASSQPYKNNREIGTLSFNGNKYGSTVYETYISNVTTSSGSNVVYDERRYAITTRHDTNNGGTLYDGEEMLFGRQNSIDHYESIWDASNTTT